MRALLPLLLIVLATATRADELSEARKRWESSPHGPMLERILPPTFDAGDLPEPGSRGAQPYPALLRAVPQPRQPGDA